MLCPRFTSNTRSTRRPGLAVTYLRSYERFGAATITIGYNDEQVHSLIAVQHAYRRTCDRLTRHGADTDKFNYQYSRKCSQHLAGSLRDPWVLDGHWDDRSSQAFVTPFVHPWHLEHDKYLRAGRIHQPHVGPEYATLDLASPLVAPGLQRVVIAFAGWSQSHGQTRFKLMELRSC